MTNVFNYSTEDWLTMKFYKDSISYLKTKDRTKFRTALEKEEALYKDYIRQGNKVN